MNKFEMTGYRKLDELLERINNGESVNIRDETEYTALILASYNGYFNIAQQLLKCFEINVNLQTNNGATALMYATHIENIEIVKELLEHPDININIKDCNNKTALDYAIKGNRTKTIALLQTYSYIQENKEQFELLGIDNSIVEAVISKNNCFETNKQNIDSLIQQYRNNGCSLIENIAEEL